mmetsp:Transcript_101624/g.270278  ORF Transcript_101624/g.270278 Transcript_101624/m.270278 type:complete len:229 (-) Transcript_101624:292-978(-)
MILLLDSPETTGMSWRFCWRKDRTFLWWVRISAFRRFSTLWLLFLCATSLFTAEAAASSGEGGARRRGASEWSSSGASASSLPPSASPSAASSLLPCAPASPSPPPACCSPALGLAAAACAHCRLPSTAAIAADIAALDALAAAKDARTAAPTKRSAAAVLPAAPSSDAPPGPCSSAAVVSVTSAQARAEFRASRPRVMAVAERSAHSAADGFLFAAMRHWAATSSVA